MQTRRQVGRFVVTGTCGFSVDALLMLAVAELFGVSALVARSVSFPVAVVVTWILNRKWTFEHGRSRAPSEQYVLYLLGQFGTLTINYSIFAGLVVHVQVFAEQPLLALAVGAGVALGFSYLFARFLAFQRVD